MKARKNSAFTLIETMVAMVIGMICVAAILYAYQFFSKSYQGLLDKAAISNSGRTSLSMIARDLRNAGYKDINYNRFSWDRRIEQIDNYNSSGADSLVVWYNTSPTERLKISYFLKKYNTSNDMYLAKEVIENPKVKNSYGMGMKRNCQRYKTQKNCVPQVIVPFVTDFQVVFKDVNGNELRPVCGRDSCSSVGRDNQSKVHTAEVYLTVRSPNKIYQNNKIIKIINYNSTTGRHQTITDRYHRETFFISVYLRNIVKI